MKGKTLFVKILAECCRVLLGVVFIFSGFAKLIDPMGGAIKIIDYLASFGLQSIQDLSVPFSFCLAALEFTLGVCMLLGVYRRYTTFLVLVFMIMFTPLTLYLALFNPVSDCGCFGDALVISNWETFFKNVVLLAASIVTLKFNRRLFACYTYRVYWFVPLFAYLYALGFGYYNYAHLPLIDFRPFKKGADIPELMAVPDDAEADEYEYLFVYEKDGKQQTFSIDDYPADDPEWTFVESKLRLLKKGFTPKVEAFNLYTGFGEDIGEILLSDTGFVFMLIAPKLETANGDVVDEINGIYEFTLKNQIPFWGITGSSSDEIENWRDFTGAEYPFLMGDEILLKTMIRSNPGLVILKNGTIFDKIHYNDFPAEEDAENQFTPILTESNVKNQEDGWLVTNLLTFTVPLLLVWLYDFFRNRRRRKPLATE